MDTTTLDTIRQHIIDGEKQPPNPYLDIKGNLTIGTGFHIKTEEEFLSLPLINERTGKQATEDEKKAEFANMNRLRERQAKSPEGFNLKAERYEDLTSLRMPKAEQDTRLDREIATRVTDIKKGVGEDAWNKLTDGQKAVAVDLHYANGGLGGFPKFKEAIKRGDAQAMARESLFFTDKEKGIRDNERLVRNRRAITGEDDQTARNTISAQTKPSKDDQSGDGPGFGNNGPTGQDDDMSDDTPSGNGPSSDSDSQGSGGGDAQNQSARLPDPGDDPNANTETKELRLGEEGKPETLELKLGPDGKPITKELTPEQNLLLKDFDKTDGPLDDILAKDPGDLTETEFLEVKKAMIDLPAGPEQERLDAVATEFLNEKFGTDPAKVDAVGRLIDPEPIRPINKTPVPARTPDGEILTNAVNKIGRIVVGAAGNDGRAPAVQGLQTGLNLLKSIMAGSAKTSRSKTPILAPGFFSNLKTDGVVGPKTRRALKIAASGLGRPKVEEGFALGRFGQFAKDLQTGRADGRDLKPIIEKSFGPLFRDPKAPRPRPNRPAEENLSFQSTINDLGFNAFGRDRFKPIKEDGFIGPRTESAFNAVLPAAGPDRFTSRFGHNLGFFDFDDFG